MNLRLEQPGTRVERTIQALAVATVAVTAVLLLLLMREAVTGGVDHLTLRIDNRAALGLEVDAVDGAGDAQRLPTAPARSLTTVDRVVDQGQTWTIVVTYGGREVFRQDLTRAELAGQGWTVRIPAEAAADLERQGLR
jgi:hypothetical protein